MMHKTEIEKLQKELRSVQRQLEAQKEYNQLLTYNLNKFQDGIAKIRTLLKERNYLSDMELLDDIQNLIEGSINVL